MRNAVMHRSLRGTHSCIMATTHFVFWVALFATSGALAQSQAAQLREAIAVLNTEQQAVYQQFQMLQTLRQQTVPYDQTPPSGPPQNYDDVMAQRRASEEQMKRYQGDMDALYQRYRELEEQKQPLLLQLRQLALEPAAPTMPPAASGRPPSGRTDGGSRY